MLYFPDYSKTKNPSREFFFTVSMPVDHSTEQMYPSVEGSLSGDNLHPGKLGLHIRGSNTTIDSQHHHAGVAEGRGSSSYQEAAARSLEGVEGTLRRDDERTL